MRETKLGPTIADFASKVDLFSQQLGPAQQRRLYLLILALRETDPEEAVALAERMESFVVGERRANCTRSPGAESCGDRHEIADDEQQASGAGAVCGSGGGRPVPARADRNPTDKRALLTKEAQAEFLRRIAAGDSNEQLAAKFRLTLRQANGLRLGLSRRKHPTADAAAASRSAPPEKEEACPRRKQLEPPTLDDVVGFLRQHNDIVVRQAEYFAVNGRHLLTPGQLVIRANRLRVEQGKKPFHISLYAESSNGSPRPRAIEIPNPDRAAVLSKTKQVAYSPAT